MSIAPSDRSLIRRGPRKARYDDATIEAILDDALVAHVAIVHEGEPACIPMLFARVGDRVYVHGSRASRLMRALSAGVPACLTVTLLDGLVLARSVFEHSANYRSVVAYGRFGLVEDPDEKLAALEAFTEKLLPGRWAEVRAPNRKELRAVTILGLEIGEASAKVRSGPPDDDESEDAKLDVWAGSVPIVTSLGEPVPSPGLRGSIPVSASVRNLVARRARRTAG